MNNSLDYQPIIIVGAGRSGTNMLRDGLVKLEGCGTWDCDEINYIWRYGNRGHKSDELSAVLASTRTKRYINRAFNRLAAKEKCQFVIEKTCANSLRVPFVDAIVPGAKYINIVRDGCDVVSSALQRWTATIEPGYLAKKARYVPITDIPYYFSKYASHRIRKHFRKDKSLPSWGPIYDGMPEDIKILTVPEVCALQWKHCVERSGLELANSPNESLTVVYEEFVENPAQGMRCIVDFIGLSADENVIRNVVSNISNRSVGKGEIILNSHPQVAAIISSVDRRW